MLHLRCRAAPIVFAVGLAPIVTAAQPPALADVLKAAADYVLKFAGPAMVIEAEEQQTQYDTSSGQIGGSRRLKSDFVVVALDDGRVSSFRDTFEIDGRPLRERQNRLLDLLRSTDDTTVDRLGELSEASVRSYISPNLYVLGDPTLPLQFLRQQNQPRFAFKPDGVRTMDGRQVAIVRFSEEGAERFIQTPEKAPVTGRLWIDAGTGAVRQAELVFSGKEFNLRSTTKYALDQKLGLWLPSEMVLNSDVRGLGHNNTASNMGAGGQLAVRQSLEARVTYSQYRQVTKPDR
jgi:hypothetical protein